LVFKRRTPKGYWESFVEFFYPRGGWRRALRYVAYRLRRLPDPAHKISRGIAAGVFVSFTPLFGMHFFLAAFLAWMMRGNVLASLLATFFGNPLTFPLIAAVSVETGNWILGRPPIPLTDVVGAFTFASLEIWANIVAIFTPAQVAWGNLAEFMNAVFLPYLIGGIVPGIVMALAAYLLANPVIASYQRGRIKRLKLRFEKRRRAIEAARAAKAEKAAEAYKAERAAQSE
jgi:uncharacterized protein (DUF2062 family)